MNNRQEILALIEKTENKILKEKILFMQSQRYISNFIVQNQCVALLTAFGFGWYYGKKGGKIKIGKKIKSLSYVLPMELSNLILQKLLTKMKSL